MSDDRKILRNALDGSKLHSPIDRILFLCDESSENDGREMRVFDHPDWGSGLYFEINIREGNGGYDRSTTQIAIPTKDIAHLFAFLREYLENSLRAEEEYYRVEEESNK